MKKVNNTTEKKLEMKELVKILNLSPSQIYIVERFFKDRLFTEKRWIEELKSRKIL